MAYLIAFREKNIKKIAMYVGIGFPALYAANIVRIMMIILVGYYKGYEAMLFAHSHLGWVIFVLAMFFFWYFVFETHEKVDKKERER